MSSVNFWCLFWDFFYDYFFLVCGIWFNLFYVYVLNIGSFNYGVFKDLWIGEVKILGFYC